jgi:hypothetical protein
MRPMLAVAEGDRVRRGQLLFEDKKTPGVRYTAPAAGVVTAIHRGERRFMLSVEIGVEGEDGDAPTSIRVLRPRAAAQPDTRTGPGPVAGRRRVDGAAHPPLRQGAGAGQRAAAIFVPLIDTQPLAPDPDIIVGRARRRLPRRPGAAGAADRRSGVGLPARGLGAAVVRWQRAASARSTSPARTRRATRARTSTSWTRCTRRRPSGWSATRT